MSEGAAPFEVVVDAQQAGERLDKLLTLCTSISRSTLARWVEEGRVEVDGHVGRVAMRVKAGMRIRVTPAPPLPSSATPEDIPLAILFEDPYLLVVDKPAGLVVHPAAGHASGTLVNAILHHTHVDDEDPARPGIVHRLDKDTSGVMVIAKTPAARDGLVALFAAHDLERMYLAIATGAPTTGTYDTLHGRHPRDRKRFTTKVTEGKRAVTHVTVRERLHGAALVECRLETGRTHQIRVHLAEAGFPLLGDATYGKPPRDPRLREAARVLGRQALHAAVLGFVHPITGHKVRFETPPPPDFTAALATLRR